MIELKNIYRVLELNQSQWLNSYVKSNTEKGKEAKQ